MEALSSMRRDAEVAPKCLLGSLVIREKRDSLERALEAKTRGRREEKVRRVIMEGCGTTRSPRNNARGPEEHRDNGTTLTYANLHLHLSFTKNST